MNRLQVVLALLRGIHKFGHDAIDKCNRHAMIRKNSFLGLGIRLAERRAAGFPAVHEMIGRERGVEQFGSVAFQLAENFRGEFVVLLAQRGDPGAERQRFPATQVSREGYEFFSRSLADFGLLTS